MAGYSGTPLRQKLGIKESCRIAIIGPPADFSEKLGELPTGVAVRSSLRGGELDIIVAFFTRRATFQQRFAALKSAMAPACGLWIAWPKRASGVATDMTEDVIREIALSGGLVDNKVCAIDDTWSGLRLVMRIKDRPKKQP